MNHLESTLLPTPKQLSGSGERKMYPLQLQVPAEFASCARVFADAFAKIFEVSMTEGKNGIVLMQNPALPSGAYTLSVTETVQVTAGDCEGMHHALTTLLQLLTVRDGALWVPEVEIQDCPDKDFRGLMLDLNSVWHPMWQILKFVDLCWLYKIKYIHLHFSDNRLYTLPTKAFPKLNQPGRCYSEEEICHLCGYAQERGIVLIPEFEVPGHAKILNTAYPEIFRIAGDAGDSAIVTENGDRIDSSSIVCPGRPACMDAIRTLLGEIAALFPEMPYIHIGGDEANMDAWNYCPLCVDYMRQRSLSGVKELYSDFVGEVASMVLALGKTPIVWEGFPPEGSHRIPKETVVIAWETKYNRADQLLEQGFEIINASWQPLYIVNSLDKRWDAYDIMRWNVYNWQNWWEQSDAMLNPLTVAPTERVHGAEICSWGLSYEREMGMVMENLPALCERLWNTRRLCDDAHFYEKHRAVTTYAERLLASE